MTTYRQDIDFQGLFRKLGHSLEEIRVRALENIISKLEHSIICEQDLIHERHLFIRLLEWFNFTPCVKREQVLQLIQRLSKHWAAAELIQSIGGIEFLTQLRGDIEVRLQPVVDNILENIMHLPEAKGQGHAPECIYHKTVDSGLLGVSRMSAGEGSLSQNSMALGGSKACISPPFTASKLSSHDNISPGYFVREHEADKITADPRLYLELDDAENFKMVTFPWLPLTMTDRHVIMSTHRSLQSKEQNLLISACEFLSDVVFQDFPAEIFLQRPQIVKSLLSLLSAASAVDPVLIVCAAHTLSDLCRCLQFRIRYFQDPALYTAKQEFGSSPPSTFSLAGSSCSPSGQSSDTLPSAIGWSDRRYRGDGRDQDSSESDGRESSVGGDPVAGHAVPETDLEETDSLQYMQLSLPQFAFMVLQGALQNLRTTCQKASMELLRLGFESWKILAVVLSSDIWNSSAESARDLMARLTECLEAMAGLLDYHHHGHHDSGTVRSDEQVPVAQRRRVYIGVVSLLTHMLHLVPSDKASHVVPEKLHIILGTVLFDESLAITYPQCHAVLIQFAQLLDVEAHRILCRVTQIRLSMHDTCRFIMQAKSQMLSPSDAASLADKAVVSLPCHLYLPFIEEFLAFLSHFCSKNSADKNIQSQCSGTFLKLLSHPLLVIRQHVYEALLKIVQSKLNPVSEATDAKYNDHMETRFLLKSDILYEIICFGLADSDNKVCSLAMELIFHLLQSRLLLGDVLWSELSLGLLKSLPILQLYADLTARFGRRVWTMLDPTVASDNLCLLEKFRGNLRLMFSADVGLRSEAAKRLAWFLANESDERDKLPAPASVDTKHLVSLFITEMPCYLDDDARSVFQVEGMKQVYDIFIADPVDPGVKKSAADQLAIMLHDPHLHAAFRQAGGLEMILQVLHAAVMRPKQGEQQNPQLPYVPACVTILQYLLHHEHTLCHNLSRDASVYYDLLRASLLLQPEEGVACRVSHIFTLLLFDEVAKFDVRSSQGAHLERNFSLPAVVVKRCRLPFHVAVHHTASPSAVWGPVDEDVLKSAGPQEMLRVAWNVAWWGGLHELLDLLKFGGSRFDELCHFNRAMQLTPLDKEVLAATDLKWSLQDSVYAVLNATSHADVSSALSRILMHVATLPFADCVSSLNQLNWTSMMERFLSVTPSSVRDEQLLLEVLQFLCCVLQLSAPLPDQIQLWLAEKLYDSSGPLVGVLNSTPSGGEGKEPSSPKRSLDKILFRFISLFISHLPYKLHKRLSAPQRRGDLARKLLQRLNVSDGPHFYNLAALESTLICLTHITSRSWWSEECSDSDLSALCSQMLNCLLEVVSAFHIGRGGSPMSYMGKGVTKAATMCLRHLAYEVTSTTRDKEWAKNWLYSRQGTDAVAEPGLNWMLTLWAYRDAEVRAAGLGIAVALTSTEAGCMMVTNNCKHIPGGIWGASFSILLDHSECSIVRQQAALLLVNLTSQVIPSITTAAALSSSTWQGPVVVDVESDVSLVGLPALLALLHHSQFYRHLQTILISFFPSCTLQPVLLTTEVPLYSLDSSQLTVTPSGSSLSGYSSQGALSSSRTGPVEMSSALKAQESFTEPLLGRTSSTHGARSSRTGSMPGLHQNSLSAATEAPCDEGMESIVTPCLVAAVTQLLRNLAILAPQDTFTYLASHNVLPVLISMIDPELLQHLSAQVTAGPHGSSSLLALRDILRMYDAIVSLLRTCLVLDTPSRTTILNNQQVLKAVTLLLLIQCDSSGDLAIECRHLWHSVLSLLISLLQMQSAAGLQCLTQALAPLWPDLCDALVHLLEISSEETQHLCTACTSFLSLLLMEEARRLGRSPDQLQDSITLSSLLDASGAKCSRDDSDVQTTGSSLCKVLVRMYELSTGKREAGCHGQMGKKAVQVTNALKSLLAVSQTAKHMALDMGLVESLIENLKQTHARLSVEALQVNRMGKKKDDGVLQELILTVNMLRNLLCGSEQVKVASTHSGLAGVLHKLWAWCLQESPLMSAVLSLLVTFTAHCPIAASSLSATGAMVLGPHASHQQVMSSSIVLSITKLAQREIERELANASSAKVSPLLKLLFSLISTLALSAECRTLIWKSNFLQEFSNLSPMRSRKSRGHQMLDVLWLELGVSLSFSTDGQQMLLRLDGCLTVLLDFMNSGSGRSQECAVLILRNMCCHAANKPKILANDQVIPSCVCLVESGSLQVQTLAASALWGLAYNNHKAKMAMKNVNVFVRLQGCLKNMRNMGQTFQDVRCTESIQAVISLIAD